MSGLNSIIEKIRADGQSVCDDIIKSAELKAEKIISEAKANAEEAYEKSLVKADEICKRDYEAGVSNAETDAKLQLLKLKVDAVDKCIENALSSLRNADDNVYFENLLTVFKNYADSKKSGKVCLGEKDLKRCPDSFRKAVSELSDGNISVDAAPSDINDGFLLVYGDTAENCTFDALLSADYENIRDGVISALFG